MVAPNFDKPRVKLELPPSSDPLSEALQLLHLSGVLYCNAELSEPWGIALPALPGVMNVEVVTSGHCWVEVDGHEPQRLCEGGLMLIPRGLAHRLRSDPHAPATPLEDIPVERVTERFENMRFGGHGPTTRITYFGVRFDPILADRLVRLLPDFLSLRTDINNNNWLHSTIQLIGREARQRLPGSETVITRLADVLVIQAIRTWIEQVRDEERGWIAALHDPRIGKAISLMHRHPERDWRVNTLAREIGMSRSAFSARFTEMVGESVLQYLTDRRMRLAYRDLCQSTDTLAQIAERVGYSSEPAFNRAFKRVMGQSPGSIRKATRV